MSKSNVSNHSIKSVIFVQLKSSSKLEVTKVTEFKSDDEEI